MIIKRKPRAEALFQIMLLIVGVIAISYAIGSSIEIVSATKDEGAQCEPLKDLNTCEGSVVMYCSSSKVWKKLIDCSILNQICSAGNCIDFEVNSYPEKSNFNIPTNPNLQIGDEKSFGFSDLVSLGGNVFQSYNLGKSLLTSAVAPGTLTPAQIAAAEEATKSALATIAPKWGGVILKTVGWATAIYFGIRFIGSKVTDDVNIQRGFNTAAAGATIGYTAGRIATQIVMKKVAKKVSAEVAKGVAVEAAKTAVMEGLGPITSLIAIPAFGWIMAGAGVILSVLFFKNERYQQITYQCNAWQPQTGGDDCELCNNQGLLPCTDYQCRSLGQSCELINPGTGNEKCVWINPNDIKYPIIKPWDDALLNEKYRYTPSNTISPPDRGVIIQYQSGDGCIPAFTPLSFGISLDEPGRCQISPIRASSFETMGGLFLSGGIADYNHSYSLSMPGSSSLDSESIPIKNDGNYELYVRCEDKNGNSNPANFVFKYCVDSEPDYTNPLIVFADPLNGKPVAYNTESLDAMFYINEPAECRWDHLNKDYENMENSMSCATSVLEMNAYMLYPCTTTLTGLQNNVENKFYVRCKDQPGLTGDEAGNRNTNRESYEYILIGTEPLILSWVTPNNTLIKGPTTSVKVKIEAETSAGYEDGISTCYYSETGDDGSYVQFYDTNSFKHSQDLWVSQGSYDFYIRCVDLGGNTDTATINFDVETDTEAPIIARVYRKGDYLKLTTDEEAECRYGTSSNVGCDYNFEEGTLMISTDDLEHYVDWNSNVNFYIKCGEIREGGLYPPQNECSLIVRPFDIL